MAYDKSFGFVETVGLVTAIEVADAMTKSARVEVKTVANADAALISVVCEGDLASCQAAVDAGKAAAARLGEVTGSNLIARPDDDTNRMVTEFIGSIVSTQPTVESKAKAKATSGQGAKGGGKKK